MIVLDGVGDLERLVVTVITSVVPEVGTSESSAFMVRLRGAPA